MPYNQGNRLPGERASRLGHLDVLNSPLVNQLVHSFEEEPPSPDNIQVQWLALPATGESLDIIFAVDGSLQTIRDELPPHKSLSFVKTALMRIDQVALDRIDKDSPHPFELRDLMAESALYHATVFPLQHVQLKGITIYDAVRQIIFESMRDTSLNGDIFETLKWIVYEKWSGEEKNVPPFECPHCHKTGATLPYDAEKGACPYCGKELFLTDMLGFHLEMVEDAARESVASAYMLVHETLMLFTGVRLYWETNRAILKRCLFLKDGPLQIRAQYSKLVAPIRRFLMHAYRQDVPICIIGQEKTGIFVDHFELFKHSAPPDSYFVPDHKYICEEIQQRPADGAPYGQDTNYGAKIFLTLTDRYRFVFTLPVMQSMREFIVAPDPTKLIGFDRIVTTLPSLVSSRHENALMPIELAHSIASLSTYPSAQVLKLFATAEMKTH